MPEIPPVRQSSIARDVLRLVAPGIGLGLLMALLVPLSRGYALSLDAGVQVPLLRAIDITSDISLLEPVSPLVVSMSADQSAAESPVSSQLIDLHVATQPTIPFVPMPPVKVIGAPPRPAKPIIPTPAKAVTAAHSNSATKATNSHTTPKTQGSRVSALVHSKVPQRRNFLGFDFPNGFGVLPDTVSGKDGSFHMVLIILIGMTVMFLGFATATTATWTRGSPPRI
jgi:hypothetical protein